MTLEEEMNSFCTNVLQKPNDTLEIWSTTSISYKIRSSFNNHGDTNYLRYERLEELIKSGKLYSIPRRLPMFEAGYKELQKLAKFYNKAVKKGWLDNSREIDGCSYNYEVADSANRGSRGTYLNNNFHFAISKTNGTLFTVEGFKKCVSPAYLLKFSRLLRDAEIRCKKHPRFKNG
jgi:hypothetical protein